MMKQQTIVQFVGFATNIEKEEFAAEWKGYTETLNTAKTKTTLYGQLTAKRSSFRYVSKFEWPESDFQFTAIKEQKPGRFSESKVRVLQMGGYITTEEKTVYNETKNDTTVVAFISHNEYDIAYYEGLPLYSRLIIHQAYFESCTYGYIMEFTMPASVAEAFLPHLEKRPGVDAGMYNSGLFQKSRRMVSPV